MQGWNVVAQWKRLLAKTAAVAAAFAAYAAERVRIFFLLSGYFLDWDISFTKTGRVEWGEGTFSSLLDVWMFPLFPKLPFPTFSHLLGQDVCWYIAVPQKGGQLGEAWKEEGGRTVLTFSDLNAFYLLSLSHTAVASSYKHSVTAHTCSRKEHFLCYRGVVGHSLTHSIGGKSFSLWKFFCLCFCCFFLSVCESETLGEQRCLKSFETKVRLLWQNVSTIGNLHQIHKQFWLLIENVFWPQWNNI